MRMAAVCAGSHVRLPTAPRRAYAARHGGRMGTHRSTGRPQLSEPTYRLAFLVDGDILKVQVSGDVDAQPVRLAYLGEIVAIAQARNCRKVLMIDRKKGSPATPEEHGELALAFRDAASMFDRIAVVEPTAEFLPAMQHGEIHALSLDINLRIFADAGNAERWLRFGSADD